MILLVLSLANAEESKFEGAKAGDLGGTTEAHASAEMGGTFSFGNTESMALTGLGTASYRYHRNGFSTTFGVNWGQTKLDLDADGKLSDAERDADYVKSAEREYATLRYDRFLGKRDSLYLLGGAFTDSFAGYDYRLNGQLGWSHNFIDREAGALRGELGVDIAREDFVEGIAPNAQTVVAARLLLGGRYSFNKHVAFEDTLEIYEGVLDFTDLRVNNTASISAALGGKLSLKLSHVLAFDNVPVEGYQPLDHTTMGTVVVTFL